MIYLPNHCYASDLNVFPKNWKSSRASTKKEWYISYRFYDPQFKHLPQYKKGKLVIVKRMNQYKDLAERRGATEAMIQAELIRLQEKAYNPITGYSLETVFSASIISSQTPFIEALELAEKQHGGSPTTKRDFRSALRYFTKAASQLQLTNLSIGSISRKHIKVLLQQIEDSQEKQSPHRYNKMRTCLMMLFNELLEVEAVEYNPVNNIKKKKGVERLRKLLPEDKRLIIDKHLKEHHYRFWLFTHIFFHSGARLTEMMQVKKHHVDLENQVFMVTIKKGQLLKEVIKPIKDVVLPHWIEALNDAAPQEFIFSRNLYPGPKAIGSFQITKRWNKHVKKKLGIEEDFYSLKHLNLDQTAALLDINAAAAMASHKNTAITLKHYTVNESSRQIERLKKIQNRFGD